MQNLRASCSCGRQMTPDIRGGAGGLKCLCGTRVSIEFAPDGCMEAVPGKGRPISKWFICGSEVVRRHHSIPLCAHHYEQAIVRQELILEDAFVPPPKYKVVVREAQDGALTAHHQRMADNPEKVYFARFGDIVKIGFSRDPERRIQALSLGKQVYIVHTRLGGRSDESALHKMFAAHRVDGEWFTWCPEIAEWIDNDREITQ